MKYMIMMNVVGAEPYEIFSWAKDDLEAHMAFLNDLNEELTAAGEMVSVEGLKAPDEAKLVRAADDGTPITDGVFPESKEFLAGYWIVDVDSPERVYELAARVSAAPGPGGEPLDMPVEVREVMSGVPSDLP